MPTHREKAYTLSVTIGAIVNVVVNLILIARYQIMGAALTTSISEAVVFLIQLGLISTQVQISKLFHGTLKYLLAGLMMYLAVSRLDSIMKMTLTNLAAQVILGAGLYLTALIIFKAPIIDRAISIVKSIINRKLASKENR